MRCALLVVLTLTACADTVVHPGSRSDRQQVLPPILKPPDVVPVDANVLHVYVGSPAVAPPQVRPPRQVDLFRQSQAVVDILFVVSDAGSMVDERALLASNFPRFLDQVVAAKSDYRIGVTTTDLVPPDGIDGKLRGPFIDPTTTDAQATFQTEVTFTGRSSVRWQQGLAAAVRAVTPGVNPGFIRPEAALAVIFVTDDDDSSFGTTGYFVRFFRSLKGPGNENRVTLSAISGPVPDGCAHPGEEDWLGGQIDPSLRFKAVVDGTDGAFGSICDTDFVSSLTRIALALNTLKKDFPLSFVPLDPTDSTKFEVRVNETPGDTGPGKVIPSSQWQFRPGTNSVVFTGSYIPPPRSLVEVDYVVSSTGTTG